LKPETNGPPGRKLQESVMPEVHVYLAEGRTVEQKKKLMKALSDAVVSSIGADINAVTVQIMEAPGTDKMKGGLTFEERATKK
jgi:4-oxalocrotonate tautomerase